MPGDSEGIDRGDGEIKEHQMLPANQKSGREVRNIFLTHDLQKEPTLSTP